MSLLNASSCWTAGGVAAAVVRRATWREAEREADWTRRGGEGLGTWDYPGSWDARSEMVWLGPGFLLSRHWSELADT